MQLRRLLRRLRPRGVRRETVVPKMTEGKMHVSGYVRADVWARVCEKYPDLNTSKTIELALSELVAEDEEERADG